MLMSKLLGERFKEKPSEATSTSHVFLLRGGYVRQVTNGIYTLLPPAKRIAAKIENIIREEMDAIDGQEVLFPVALPGDLWKESGRFEAVGSELVRFKDRANKDMILGMTHEEAAVHLARSEAKSYADYPFMIYQIQTKFRDEPRARGGLIRVREFTMKDAYSFHTSQEDLEEYYQRCYDAYNRVFARAGVPEVVTVASDSGMMGGSVSHEYMLLNEIGEDSIVLCEDCDYSANMEAAQNIVENNFDIPVAEMAEVHTPDKKTMEEVCEYLNADLKLSCKAVVYQKNADDKFVVAFTRGDFEVNETKLRNLVGEEIHPAVIDEESPVVAGFIGPVGISKDVEVYYDLSLKGIPALVAGANKIDYHFTGVNLERDVEGVVYHDIAKVVEGGICPKCGKHSLTIKRGIEVGNIFQLGTKYTESMGMTYTDKDGVVHNPIMGCYGIGVGRLAASVCEAKHDDYGPIWPISIAPWEVHLCCLRADDEQTKAVADDMYAKLKAAGAEVIYDDRAGIRPGEMFADADLLGVPIRVVVSPRNLKENKIEISTRDKSVKDSVDMENALEYVLNLKKEMFDALNK